MQELDDLIAKVNGQSAALDSIITDVNGIAGDIAALKQIIADLQGSADAAVLAAIGQISPVVEAVSAKITAIGQTTSDLDAQTS